MSADIRYALIYSPKRGDKVIAFDSLRRLCAEVQSMRRGAMLQLEETELLFQGESDKRQLVSLYTLDDSGARMDFLGHAWLDGRGQPVLETALRSFAPEAVPYAVAA